MPRSLRAWLASLALIAFPGLAQGQTFLGPPHLAPVALEARCPLVDGLGGAVAHFMALGADPLQVALMKADAAARGGAATADVASQPAGAADRATAAETAVDRDLQDSLARLAAAEPVDVAVRGGDGASSEGKSPLAGSSAVIVGLQEEYLPYDLRGDDLPRLRLLPFSTPRSCPLASRPAAPLTAEAALAMDNAVCDELAACYAIASLKPPAPHAAAAAVTSNAAAEAIAAGDAAAPQEAIVDFAELIPSGQEWVAAGQWIAAQRPPTPLHCWLDEAIGQVSEVLEAQGPIHRELNAEQMGARLALGGLYAGRSIVDAAEPVMPILARVPAAQAAPAAAPAGRPGAIEAAPLSLAAGALHSAAGQLEYLAASLRQWGTSVDRVARAKVAAPAALRR